MINYNRIAYEIDTVTAPPPTDVLGISMLHHFEADYPEAWSFKGNTSLSTSSKFGKTCAYFQDATSNVTITNTTGLFNLNPLGNYEFEAFVNYSSAGNIFAINDLMLTINSSGYLVLSSTTWDISATTTTTISTNTWHHVLLRITDENVNVFIDGSKALSKVIYNPETITPEKIVLGGYIGYMDEFVFRRNAGTNATIVPTNPYDINVIVETVEVPVPVEKTSAGNAPVSRVAWSCDNLPDGLTLSSAGVLSGKPTTTGTYKCDVSVTTNWGTTVKKLKIVIE